MGRMAKRNQREPMFSSARTDWRTPEDAYRELSEEFGGFDHDPCPPTPSADGLFSSWGQRNFVNPPYGNGIHRWLGKALHESRQGKLCVLLIPARTDTSWWHTYVMQADEVRYVRGRLHFGGSRNAAPFPSAVVIFQPRPQPPSAGVAVPAQPRGGEPAGRAAAEVAARAPDLRATDAVGAGATGWDPVRGRPVRDGETGHWWN